MIELESVGMASEGRSRMTTLKYLPYGQSASASGTAENPLQSARPRPYTPAKMEAEFRFDSSEQWLCIRLSGLADIEGYLGYLESALLQVARHQACLLFSDHRGVEGVEHISAPDLQRMVDWFAARRNIVSGKRCAIVVRGPLHFGLTRMWQTYLEFEDIDYVHCAFHDPERAKAWLREQRRSMSRDAGL